MCSFVIQNNQRLPQLCCLLVSITLRARRLTGAESSPAGWGPGTGGSVCLCWLLNAAQEQAQDSHTAASSQGSLHAAAFPDCRAVLSPRHHSPALTSLNTSWFQRECQPRVWNCSADIHSKALLSSKGASSSWLGLWSHLCLVPPGPGNTQLRQHKQHCVWPPHRFPWLSHQLPEQIAASSHSEISAED